MSDFYNNSMGEASSDFMDSGERSGWISCEVSQPKLEDSGQQDFIVTKICEDFYFAFSTTLVSIATWDYFSKEWLCEPNEEIVAWQPLPKPYVGE